MNKEERKTAVKFLAKSYSTIKLEQQASLAAYFTNTDYYEILLKDIKRLKNKDYTDYSD